MPNIILLNEDLKEIGNIDIDIDVEIGTSEAANDFEIQTAEIQQYSPHAFYIPGTEIGGIFEYIKATSESDIQTIKGWAWRGLLAQSLILPPSGSDYKTVSGEANSIISSILSGVLGGFFTVPTEDSGLNITSYQFPLYINILDGLEGMLEKNGYRLNIHAEKIAANSPIQIVVEAVESVRVSGAYNNDSGIPMTYTINAMGINHLLCAGQGELQERLKVDLYIDENGNVSETQYFTGFDERTAFYDYSSAESREDLVDGGTKRLLELASSKTIEIKSPDDMELEIGDTVQGVFPDGSVVISPIIKKIYKIKDGLISTDIKIKGEQ